jgi:hypothetical protein
MLLGNIHDLLVQIDYRVRPLFSESIPTAPFSAGLRPVLSARFQVPGASAGIVELLAPQKQVSRERPSGADFFNSTSLSAFEIADLLFRIPLSSRRPAGVLIQARMVIGLILRDDARQKGECKRSIKVGPME